MTIWIDAQLSPALASWIRETLAIDAVALRDLRMRDANDRQIFQAAKLQSAIVMTKDADFVKLLDELGPPPSVIWITCGNTSNSRLISILRASLPRACELINSGESLVEISDLHSSR